MALTIQELWTQNTKAELKATFISILQSAGFPATDWTLGGISERITEIIPRVLDQVLSTVIVSAVRAFFFELNTDPGDEGNADPEPKAGWLSGFGFGWYAVERRGRTFATGFEDVTNDNLTSIEVKPGDLVFRRNSAEPDGGTPTYTTTEDASIYVNPNGSVTIAAGATVTLPIQADVEGTYSNAGSGDIDEVTTGTFGSLTVTNVNPVLAEEREPREDYIARCRRSLNRVAQGSPTALYEYAANTALDGTPLQRHDGSGVVGISKVFVDDGLTEAGSVTVYCADGDGPADATDVDSADANITGIPLGVITEPIGVVPGSVDYATEPAISNTVNVVGTAKVKLADAGGLTALELQTKITDALAEYFRTFPIGGLDRVSGAGKLYTSDMVGVARDAWTGLYAVVITTPAGSSTNLALGEVATLDSDPSTDWVVTITS